jgi:KDO2-lipid IV(A) lauroyltransferase
VGRLGKKLRYGAGYLALRVALLVAKYTSLPRLQRVFAQLGALAARLARKDCQLVREHLRLAFGEQVDCEPILRAQGRHVGALLGEALWLANASCEAILACTSWVHLEQLRHALAEGRGVVLVTGHCGNWEWMNLALQAVGIPMTAAGRKLPDPRFDALLTRLRTRFGGEAVGRGGNAGQSLLRALRRGRVVGLLIDQDIAAPGVFVRFFGHPAWTPTGAAVLALRAKSPVVVGFARRTTEGTMELRFEPPLFPEGDARDERQVAQLTALLTQRIEAQVRACPEQWVWFHRRWRRKPGPGEAVWEPPG